MKNIVSTTLASRCACRYLSKYGFSVPDSLDDFLDWAWDCVKEEVQGSYFN